MITWCKGLRVDEKNKIIITWSQNVVCFNELRGNGKEKVAGNLIFQIKDLTDLDEKILDVLVFTEYRYFLTATSEGNIFVWKYSQREDAQKVLIH